MVDNKSNSDLRHQKKDDVSFTTNRDYSANVIKPVSQIISTKRVNSSESTFHQVGDVCKISKNDQVNYSHQINGVDKTGPVQKAKLVHNIGHTDTNNLSHQIGDVRKASRAHQISHIDRAISPQQVEHFHEINDTVVGDEGIEVNSNSSQYVRLVDDKPRVASVVPHLNETMKSVGEQSDKHINLEDVVSKVEDNLGEKRSKFQTFFLFVLFGGLLLLIIFLPDISKYIETQKYLNSQPIEKITTGTLKCSLETSSDSMDYTYYSDFEFSNNKLKKLIYVIETRGDVNLDGDALNSLKLECDKLADNSKSVDGVTISCKLGYGKLTQRQILDYSSIVVDDAIVAYMEAGGTYPNYKKGQDIDNIEKEMNASGFSCERIK